MVIEAVKEHQLPEPTVSLPAFVVEMKSNNSIIAVRIRSPKIIQEKNSVMYNRGY